MNFAQAIEKATNTLKTTGKEVNTKTIQGIRSPAPMWEALNVTLKAIMPEYLSAAELLIKPNLPWADEHFEERISGQPLNPPPSHVNWPFAANKNEKFKFDEKFSHTYPERYWPRHAESLGFINKGIRFVYGDLADLIQVLDKDPESRQAFLPIWFPEDLTAAVTGYRVPCSLGYHFIIRDNYLHVIYYIRSCDYFRHFRDDIYLTFRLAKWVQQSLNLPGKMIPHMGTFTMHITSLHCFLPEKAKL